jgi:DNA (cytosine-5)-methyltransferase 1
MLRVLELFAGIGACSKALTNLGIEHEIVDAVEIDKYAVKSFNAIHGTNFEPQDITKWDKDIECDLIMHGSPCQDFSVAGKNAGGDKDSGTRSSLMYETLRIVEKLKPKYVIWENVKNLLSKKHRHNFDAYLDAMTDLGYANNYQVLNAKDYGVPQNRERVFTVSIRKDIYKGYFFPAPIPLEKRLKDVLEDNVDEKYYLSDERLASLVASTEKERARGNGFKFEPIEKEKIAHAISTKAGSRKTDNYIDEGANHALRIGGLYDKDGKTHQAGSIYSAKGTAPALSTMHGGNREPYIVTGGVQIIDDIYKNRPPRFYGKTAPTIRANHAGDLKVAKIYPNKK